MLILNFLNGFIIQYFSYCTKLMRKQYLDWHITMGGDFSTIFLFKAWFYVLMVILQIFLKYIKFYQTFVAS